MKDIPFNSSRTFFFGLNFGFSIKVVCRFSVQIRNSIKKYYPQYCSVKKIMVFEITSSWLLLLGLFSISTLNCGSISEGFQYKTFAIKIRRFHHIFRWLPKFYKNFNVLKITFCNSEHMQKSYLGSCHKKLDRIGWEVLRLGYERTNR